MISSLPLAVFFEKIYNERMIFPSGLIIILNVAILEKTFWSNGYFDCSIGNLSNETIQKYIKS
jgi:REP element-mobilizing transposase RayT